MYNPDYPTTSYGWNAFTYQPYDQPQAQTGFYYTGQPSNPFGTSSNTIPAGSRRAIGQQFAQNWNGQGYGYQQVPQQHPLIQQPTPIAAPSNYPGATYGSMLSPNAFQHPTGSQSPAPAFDCIYNNNASIGSTWDKSTSQIPVWNNTYTQERQLVPPAIDWTASQKPAQQPVNYGYGYDASNINPACTPQFAQPNEDWLATVKNNFANL